MDRQMAFLVKEEILRNVIRTHEVVLVAGWAGTGKTSTALRAAKDLGDVFYFNEAEPDARALVARHNEKAVVLHDVREFGAVKSGQPLLIADEDLYTQVNEAIANYKSGNLAGIGIAEYLRQVGHKENLKKWAK